MARRYNTRGISKSRVYTFKQAARIVGISEVTFRKWPAQGLIVITDTLVLRWLDRLGRNYDDVTDAVRHFIRQGVIIRTVINDMTFDGSTTDPVQQALRDAMIAFLAASAQSQVEASKMAQQAGIELAKEKGDRFRGRKPSYDRQTFELALKLLGLGIGPSAVSKETGLSRQTLIRIRDEPDAAVAALVRWGL